MISVLFAVTVVIYSCHATCPYGTMESTVTAAEKTTIVNKHNECRILIATGQVPGQPRGVNLKRMSWDDCLAREAQRIANTCVFAHETAVCAQWGWIGQNLYTSMSTANATGSNWNAAIQSWFDEHKDYTNFGQWSSATGHYTQVVWADTNKVGCGYTYYRTNDAVFKFQKLYVCNYGPGGNYIGVNPYQVGTSGCENLC